MFSSSQYIGNSNHKFFDTFQQQKARNISLDPSSFDTLLNPRCLDNLHLFQKNKKVKNLNRIFFLKIHLVLQNQDQDIDIQNRMLCRHYHRNNLHRHNRKPHCCFRHHRFHLKSSKDIHILKDQVVVEYHHMIPAQTEKKYYKQF